MNILVSVIITVKNGEKFIADCLRSLKNQSYSAQNIEIIVVDNSSQDKTEEIARKYTNQVFDFGPERSAQRNFGIKQAQGKYILYLDVDMILCKTVIEECLEKCEGEGYFSLYIPEKIIGEGFWVKVRNFERSFYNATSIDCVRFVRRDKVLEIGGFDENLTGPEDWDFDRRIRARGKVGTIKSNLNHNEGRIQIQRYLQKKSYYSQDFNAYIKKWGKRDAIVKKQFGLWYRFFGVFFERGKWLKLLKHPLLAAGMYFLRIRVGLAYLLHTIFLNFNLRWN